uniref:Uncharacterized protein n=1 Tax=Oryza sativa subsp. japonica TaxID=39947 RepID=Q5Z527_ORYSJ|nr:hypothetical protein [Oryza sativa Japonica Group]BAD62167.1 hypothetical protein [Oryza sativa Japonica Group]
MAKLQLAHEVELQVLIDAPCRTPTPGSWVLEPRYWGRIVVVGFEAKPLELAGLPDLACRTGPTAVRPAHPNFDFPRLGPEAKFLVHCYGVDWAVAKRLETVLARSKLPPSLLVACEWASGTVLEVPPGEPAPKSCEGSGARRWPGPV